MSALHDMRAEAELLSIELYEPGTLSANSVPDDAWHDRRHSTIARALLDMSERGVVADTSTLRIELERGRLLERAGGDATLLSLTSTVPNIRNAPTLARRIRELGEMRAINTTLLRASTLIERGEFEEAREVMSMIGQSGHGEDPIIDYRDLISCGFEEAITDRSTGRGLRFGTKSVDEDYRPSPGHLVVVAGRPNVGKTSLTWSWHRDNAERGVPTGIVSVDDGAAEYGVRALGPEIGVNPADIWSKHLEPHDVAELTRRTAPILDSGALSRPIFFAKIRDQSIDSVCSAITRMVRLNGCRWVSVDFITKIRAPGRDQRERTNNAFQRLGVLASQLQIPIVVIAQLKRLGDNAFREPFLDDLKESGSLEEDAQAAVLIWRESDQPNARVLAKIAKAKRVAAGKRFCLARDPKTGLVVQTEEQPDESGSYASTSSKKRNKW
jgi:replicative DNA helicase